MTILRTIAKAHGWEVIQDMNGSVLIRHDEMQWITKHACAFDAIRNEVKDPVALVELLKQWSEDQAKRTHSEEATPAVEALLGTKAHTKDLTEDLP